MKKRTFITSFGVTFVENMDRWIELSSADTFTIHNLIMIADESQNIIERLKFRIVRWLYKDCFDKQAKRKGIRSGLTIIQRNIKN